MKIAIKLFIWSFISFTFSNCRNDDASKNIDHWIGNYHYEETPVKAIAGYAMVMDWNLSINKQHDTCQGILEVNGQQTFMKLKTDIQGDTSKIAIIYAGLIDGSNEQLKQGDTLFTLTRISGKLKTNWFDLEPRLLDNPARECNCFEQTKNNSR